MSSVADASSSSEPGKKSIALTGGNEDLDELEGRAMVTVRTIGKRTRWLDVMRRIYKPMSF